MIITTINNNKLFIQLDSLVSRGLITVLDDKGHRKSIAVNNSNFEEMDLPADSKKIFLKIETGSETITKTINLL
jgi:hypothetical protein